MNAKKQKSNFKPSSSSSFTKNPIKKTFYDSFITTKNKNTITVNVWNRKVEIKQQKTSSHECLEILCNLAKNGFITIEEDRQENR